MLRRIAIALGGTVMFASAAHSQAALPQTPSEHYQVGQQFASCSAYFRYGANLARANGLEDSAVAIEGMERGWKVAGMLLLVDGLDQTRQLEVVDIFENFQAIKMDQIKASREMAEARGAEFDPAADYQAECGELSDMQKAIIQAMRSGPITQ